MFQGSFHDVARSADGSICLTGIAIHAWKLEYLPHWYCLAWTSPFTGRQIDVQQQHQWKVPSR